MRSETQVVVQGGFESSFEVGDGQRLVVLELRGQLERSPESLEPSCGEDPADGPEAVDDSESCGSLAEDGSREFPALVGDDVLGLSGRPSRRF